jgi:hypothetical protein
MRFQGTFKTDALVFDVKASIKCNFGQNLLLSLEWSLQPERPALSFEHLTISCSISKIVTKMGSIYAVRVNSLIYEVHSKNNFRFD